MSDQTKRPPLSQGWEQIGGGPIGQRCYRPDAGGWICSIFVDNAAPDARGVIQPRTVFMPNMAVWTAAIAAAIGSPKTPSPTADGGKLLTAVQASQSLLTQVIQVLMRINNDVGGLMQQGNASGLLLTAIGDIQTKLTTLLQVNSVAQTEAVLRRIEDSLNGLATYVEAYGRPAKISLDFAQATYERQPVPTLPNRPGS